MAEDGAGSPGGSPSPDGMENGKRPESRESPNHREQRSPRVPVSEQNGHYYHLSGHNGMYQNGVSEHGSDDSREEEESMDSNYDAPLDFSLKKREHISDTEESKNDSGLEPITPPPSNESQREGMFFYKPGPTVFPQVNGLHSPPMPKSENCVSPRQCKSEPEKIGEPQTALPGMVPGMTLPTSAAQVGLLPGFPSMPGVGLLPQAGLLSALPFLQMDPRAAGAAAAAAAALAGHPPHPAQGQQVSGGKNGSSRPFKAYPKDSLSLPLGAYGPPGLPQGISNVDIAAAQAMSANSEEVFAQYRQFLQKMQEQGSPEKPKNGHHKHDKARERRTSGGHTPTILVSSTTTPSGSEQGSPIAGSIPISLTTATPITNSLNSPVITPSKAPTSRSSNSASRKRPKTMPDDMKDGAYWERRRKNNEAAKRSRDARRAKEDEIAIRAAFLEQENLKLRVEVAALKNETSKLRCMLYNS